MGRLAKQGLEYFRHYTRIQGKTMDTLQADFGNDGYAFWFKLLEILAQQDGLFYDCNNTANWRYLAANAKMTREKAEEILELLCDLEAIDSELWHEKRIIWVQNLVENAKDVYEKRKTQLPQKPCFCDGNDSSSGISVTEMTADSNKTDFSDTESTQSKVKKSKEKNSKEFKDIVDASASTVTKFKIPLLCEVDEYCTQRNNGINAQQFIDYYTANGWRVGRNPMKDWKAAVRTWEKNRKFDKPSSPQQNTGLAYDPNRQYGTTLE